MPVQGDQISAFNKKLGWIWLGLLRCMISTAYAFVSCSLVEVCDYFFFCSWLSVLLIMAYMGTVTVILLNILVAQMSTTYSQAKKVARLEYDADRILQLTRMERLPFLVSRSIW